jgi:2-hydroxychromene-2-carboxylate isomerase
VIGKILADMSQVAAPIMQAAQAQESKDAFRAQADRAMALGIIGAPSYAVDGEIFWGGDRLAAALDWAGGKRTVVAL